MITYRLLSGADFISLYDCFSNEALKVNTIDENLNGTLAFFEANWFQITLKQYEMIRALL